MSQSGLHSPDRPARRTHTPALDCLRALASFTVLVCHARGGHWLAWNELDPASRHPLSFAFFTWGRLAHESVIVFLVLSGYLIGGACWQKIRAGAFHPGSYAMDRGARIYLGYLPALLLSLWVDRYFLGSDANSLLLFVGHAAFLQSILTPQLHSNPALWTLAYLVWFAVFAGGFGACFSPRLRTRWLGGVVTLGALALLLHTNLLLFACWLFGAAARNLPVGTRSLTCSLAGLALAVLGIVVIQFGSNNGLLVAYVPSSPLARGAGELLLGLGLALTLPGASTLRMPAMFVRACAWFAGFSFSLYLVHMPILAAWSTFHPERHAEISLETCLTFSAKLLVCLAVAWLFHRFFEAPLPTFRAWLHRRLGKTTRALHTSPPCAAS